MSLLAWIKALLLGTAIHAGWHQRQDERLAYLERDLQAMQLEVERTREYERRRYGSSPR